MINIIKRLRSTGEQKIVPFLWYDKTKAAEAAQLYTSIFRDSKIEKTLRVDSAPSGPVEVITVKLLGYELNLMGAGPEFKINPSVSFTVICDTRAELDEYWGKLLQGGTVRMPLGAYPFSERYGWVDDKYGVAWQLILRGDMKVERRIIPTLLFSDKVSGKAEEAIRYYASIFKKAKVGEIYRYTKDEAPDKEGAVKHAFFKLEGLEFAAMDSERTHDTPFSEAVSFFVNCKTQKEIDYYWEKLSADPNAEQCGWLKDKYGLSWQIAPTVLLKLLADPDREKTARVTQAFLKMKKFDIEGLMDAYKGKKEREVRAA